MENMAIWNGQRAWEWYHNGWQTDGGGGVMYVDTPLYYYNSQPNLNYGYYFYPYPDHPYYYPIQKNHHVNQAYNYYSRYKIC